MNFSVTSGFDPKLTTFDVRVSFVYESKLGFSIKLFTKMNKFYFI